MIHLDRGFCFSAPSIVSGFMIRGRRLTDRNETRVKAARLQEIITRFLALPVDELSDNRQDICEMVDILVELTGVDLTHGSALDCASPTSGGRAVSLVTAGRCALEYMRSQVFMRGCYQAICDQKTGDEPVEVLYGGTGPFGLLIVPLLPLFSAKDIQVTLLDIHQPSLDYLQKLIAVLGVQDRIRAIECVDILKWPVAETQYDVIVSETMTARLRAEPQVAIFAHLVKGLKPAGVLVPQRVTIDGALIARSAKLADLLPIGRFLTLDREMAMALNAGQTGRLKCCFAAPAQTTSSHHTLQITTDICVYDGHFLALNQCSLNLPLRYDIADVSPNSRFDIEYVMSDTPELVVRHHAVPVIPEDPVWSDESPSGLPVVPSFWRYLQGQKAARTASVLSISPAQYRQIIDVLNLDFPTDLSALYSCETLDALEDLILSRNGGRISSDLRARLQAFAHVA